MLLIIRELQRRMGVPGPHPPAFQSTGKEKRLLGNVRNCGRVMCSMDAEATGIRIQHFENSRALGSGAAHGREAILARRGNSTDEHGDRQGFTSEELGRGAFSGVGSAAPANARHSRHAVLDLDLCPVKAAINATPAIAVPTHR